MLAGFLWNGWGIGALMGTRVLLAVLSEVYAFSISRKLAPRPRRAVAVVELTPS
jgi:hypothetical protein